MKLFLAAALAAGALVTAPAQATSQIDVNNLRIGSASTGNAAGSLYPEGILQTWTVGTTGLLTRIDLFGNPYGADVALATARLDFFDMTGVTAPFQQPPGALLGSLSTPLASIANFDVTSFDLSGLGIVANAGRTLAFRMRVTCTGCDASWNNVRTFNEGTSSDGYAGGSLYTWQQGPGYVAYEPRDLNFRTWVDASVAPVPEPASWAMMIGGMGLVGATMRRRARSFRFA